MNVDKKTKKQIRLEEQKEEQVETLLLLDEYREDEKIINKDQ